MIKPIIEQYQELQDKHCGQVVALRVGDFYMFFGKNAQKISRVLLITMTIRHKPNGEALLMCGFPYHQADSYCTKYKMRTGKQIVLSDNNKEE